VHEYLFLDLHFRTLDRNLSEMAETQFINGINPESQIHTYHSGFFCKKIYIQPLNMVLENSINELFEIYLCFRQINFAFYQQNIFLNINSNVLPFFQIIIKIFFITSFGIHEIKMCVWRVPLENREFIFSFP
jgi:hypothetical protein